MRYNKSTELGRNPPPRDVVVVDTTGDSRRKIAYNNIPNKEDMAHLFAKPLKRAMIDGFMKALGFDHHIQ
eukprot:1330707-Heterocapsa_arctica.AAC.1